MTSDAKVGLLLGLIFIFVIAFIINGLPNLKSPQVGKAEVSTNMVLTEENFDVAGRAPQAQEMIDWGRALDESQADLEEETAQVAAETPPVVESAQPSQGPGAAVTRETRMIMQLPDLEAMLGHLAAGLQREQGTTVNMDVPAPAPERQVASVEPAPSESVQPRMQTSVAEAVRRALAAREAAREAAQPTTTAPAPGRQAPKVYVVVEGDNLAAIAKKVYGLEEGNRVANIKRIYEANQDVLKSANEVSIGQKLVIPAPLPPLPPSVDTSKPANVLPRETFERVDQVGRQSPAATQVQNFTGRWYTVQEGDNLWKIASGELGSGARYEELAKLNADILNGSDALQVGVKLRLPPK